MLGLGRLENDDEDKNCSNGPQQITRHIEIHIQQESDNAHNRESRLEGNIEE